MCSSDLWPRRVPRHAQPVHEDGTSFSLHLRNYFPPVLSYDEITCLREHILRVKDAESVPMVLIGNKCDLEMERQVSVAEGQDLAKSFGCPAFECSAKARVNVEDLL